MTLSIIVAIVAALIILLLLVALLLVAKAKLTTTGKVTIDINGGDRVLTVDAGISLLSTLASEEIYLPSAFGEGGTCGM